MKTKSKKGGVDIKSLSSPTSIRSSSKKKITPVKRILKDNYNYNTEVSINHLTEIQAENIEQLTPLIYKLKILQIFQNYKYTNNGVILGDNSGNKLNNIIGKKNADIIRGGNSINEQCSTTILNQVAQYCGATRDRDDNNDLQDFINRGTGITISNPAYNDLRNFINVNRQFITDQYTIVSNPTYNYVDGRLSTEIITPDLNKFYNCNEYNKDIATAYEANFFTDRNKRAITNFINKQRIYLNSLNQRAKRIIQDYTNENSFNYYCEYLTEKAGRAPKIDNWRDIKTFGDAFYIQIYELYPGKIDGSLNSWLMGDRIDGTSFSSINLDINEWNSVLDKFMEDLNQIIINAPPVEYEIYCYRGVTSHYITGGIGADFISQFDNSRIMRPFNSNRLSSFSLDFNVSKRFYETGLATSSRSVYRITILPQCRVLYVSPLSLFNDEVEIIAPSNSIFYYDFNQLSGVDLQPSLCNNNIDRPFGICSKDDLKFSSFDSVLAFTPQPPESRREIDAASEIAIRTDLDLRDAFLSSAEGAIGAGGATIAIAGHVHNIANITASTTANVVKNIWGIITCCDNSQ
jgi:hypothetical protein